MLKKFVFSVILVFISNLNTAFAICHYEVSFRLNPSVAVSGSSVIPEATICCDDPTTVYFSEEECDTISPMSSCVIQANCSCTGESFPAPSTPGNYTYVACLDKNDDGIVGNVFGEIGKATLTVKGCIASDASSQYEKGDDPFVKGIVTSFEGEAEDECLDNHRLNEFYCTSSGYSEYRIINCNHWVNMECEDGKCYCVGDVNGDLKVNMMDVAQIARAYGSASVDNPATIGDETEKWDSKADLNRDGKINIKDIFKAAKKFGKDCTIETEIPKVGTVPLEVGYYSITVILITAVAMVFFFGAFKVFAKRK
jgi:hypothetical protein